MIETTRRPARLLLLLLLTIVVFVVNSGALEANIMEARNLTTAREMLEKGNWLEPTMNGELRLEKPPLPTWAAALAMRSFGQDGLGWLRLPSALAAMLLVLFLLKLTEELTDDELAPFLAAGTVATSFYVFFLARDISWDIFCHAFMLGAIWQLHRGLGAPPARPEPVGGRTAAAARASTGSPRADRATERGGGDLRSFVAAGLLMGLAFLSKGPVPFFSLLLPYLVARTVAWGFTPFRAAARPLLVSLGIALAVAAAWPVYIYLSHPEFSTRIAQKESTAWIDRNVRPFYQYWSFTAQSGIWAVLSTAALVFPYARRRIGRFADYRFLAAWIWSGVFLLSLFPEKKERYLLPVLLPLAILTALYVRYLVAAFREATATRADRLLLRLNGWLMALTAFAAPAALWWLVRRTGAAPSPGVTAASVAVFGAVGLVLARATARARPLGVWGGMVALVAAACALVLAEVPRIITRNPGFRPYHELRHRAELSGLPFFRTAHVGNKFIEVVWASGREIRHWDPREQPEPPVAPPLVLMSPGDPAAALGPELLRRYEVQELGLFDANVGKRWGGDALKNHVAIVRPRPAGTHVGHAEGAAR